MDQAKITEAAAITAKEMLSDTEFMVQVSYIYHKKRERFFRILDALSKALSILALTALATSGGPLSTALAILSGSTTIGAIVLDFVGMAVKHEALAAQFIRLHSSIISGEISVEQALLCRAKIEASEPGALRGLTQICQDEVEAAQGATVEPERLSNWRRLKAHFGYGEMPINWDPPTNNS